MANITRKSRYDLSREQADALEKLAELKTISAVCDAMGISKSTFHRWRRDDPKFHSAHAEVVEEAIAEATWEEIEAAHNHPSDTVKQKARHFLIRLSRDAEKSSAKEPDIPEPDMEKIAKYE